MYTNTILHLLVSFLYTNIYTIAVNREQRIFLENNLNTVRVIPTFRM